MTTDTNPEFFSDTAAQSTQTAGGSAAKEAAASKPFKVFETQQDYQAYFDRILGQRLKNAREQEEKLKQLEPILALLEQRYQPERSDAGAGKPSFSSRQANHQAGQPLQQELEQLSKQEGGLYQNAAGEGLAENQRFIALLSQGFSVKEAYDALHVREIAAQAEQDAVHRMTQNILTRGMRPAENVLSDLQSGRMTPDVSAMNNEEIESILERVRRGESISF